MHRAIIFQNVIHDIKSKLNILYRLNAIILFIAADFFKSFSYRLNRLIVSIKNSRNRAHIGVECGGYALSGGNSSSGIPNSRFGIPVVRNLDSGKVLPLLRLKRDSIAYCPNRNYRFYLLFF